MATGLNVIPLGATNNPYSQQCAQALRNLQVGRHQFLTAVAVLEQAVQAAGGSDADLAVLLGLTEAQAGIVHDEFTSFKAQVEGASLVAAWNQLNKIMGIIV